MGRRFMAWLDRKLLDHAVAATGPPPTRIGDQYLKFFRKYIPDLQLSEKLAATFKYDGEVVTWYFDKHVDAFDALNKVRHIRSTYWDYPEPR